MHQYLPRERGQTLFLTDLPGKGDRPFFWTDPSLEGKQSTVCREALIGLEPHRRSSVARLRKRFCAGDRARAFSSAPSEEGKSLRLNAFPGKRDRPLSGRDLWGDPFQCENRAAAIFRLISSIRSSEVVDDRRHPVLQLGQIFDVLVDAVVVHAVGGGLGSQQTVVAKVLPTAARR